MQKVLIIGAGPAGLTAAYELLDKSRDFEVIVLEESDCFGGISRTVNYKGNRMDMGGHRFFSKVPEVNAWWEKMLPTQGAMPYDDVVLGRESTTVAGGPDPEQTDRVMLRRNRLSRIFFNSKFFDYPVSLKFATIKNMGFGTTLVVGFSYLKTLFHKREEKSLEDFYINRFGKKLYSMFFENYTENLWGRHPSEISPEWGAQRVKGLSIKAVLGDIFGKMFNKKNRKVETSLIEEFAYPKLGPGQLWDLTAADVVEVVRCQECKPCVFIAKPWAFISVQYTEIIRQESISAQTVSARTEGRTMGDYISREAALDAQNKSMNLAECRKRLERLPAADAEPVRHAYWVKRMEYGVGRGYEVHTPIWSCSDCGRDYDPASCSIIKYCYICGAKMDGGQDK